MKKKVLPVSDQLWNIYFLIIALILIPIGMSFIIPGLLSEKSSFATTGGIILAFFVSIPAFLVFFCKLVVAVKRLIETKRKANESSSIWD